MALDETEIRHEPDCPQEAERIESYLVSRPKVESIDAVDHRGRTHALTRRVGEGEALVFRCCDCGAQVVDFAPADAEAVAEPARGGDSLGTRRA